MSTENYSQKDIEKTKMRLALIGSLVIVIAIIGLGIFAFFIIGDDAISQSPIPVIEIVKKDNSKVLGLETFNWNGKIMEITSSKITFSTNIKDENGQLINREVTAAINSSTKIVKWNLSTPPIAGQSNSSKELININELSPGNQITVQSTSDINGNNEVIASTISLLITPSTP